MPTPESPCPPTSQFVLVYKYLIKYFWLYFDGQNLDKFEE